MNRLRIQIPALLMALILPAAASSATMPPPKFPSAKPESKRLVVQHVYDYVRHVFEPAHAMKPVARQQASYTTPEDAFVALYSAMYAGDHAWWSSSWDKESRALMASRDKKLARSPDAWTKAWKKQLQGRRVYITERVDSGRYAFVVFELRDAAGKVSFRSMSTFKPDGKRWWATQELARDAMFHHYLKGTSPVSIRIR